MSPKDEIDSVLIYKHIKYKIHEPGPEPEPWQKTTLKFKQQEHSLLGPKQESRLHHLLFCPIPEKILIKLYWHNVLQL